MAKRPVLPVPDRSRSVEIIRPEVASRTLTTAEAMGLDTSAPETSEAPVAEALPTAKKKTTASKSTKEKKQKSTDRRVMLTSEEVIKQIDPKRNNSITILVPNDLYVDFKTCLAYAKKRSSYHAVYMNLLQQFVDQTKPLIDNYEVHRLEEAKALLEKSEAQHNNQKRK